jgi:anti-sigma factor (TIGR02949 family)
MDCKTARMLAELRGPRDTELPPEDNAALDRHLNACPECQRLLGNERRIDSRIAKAIASIPVPAGLKSRILERLATERGAWHRRRIFGVTAAAAAIVIAVGVFAWKPSGKVKPDLDGLVRIDPAQTVDPWLAELGIRYQPANDDGPVPFDSHLLAFHGMATVQGKQVPMLYYRSVEGNVTAQVYILKDADFDLSSLPKSLGGSSVFGNRVEVLKDAEHPGKLVYVVLFTGDSLKPFLVKFQST